MSAFFLRAGPDIVSVEHIVRLHKLAKTDDAAPTRVQVVMDPPSEPMILLEGKLAERVWRWLIDDFSTAEFD